MPKPQWRHFRAGEVKRKVSPRKSCSVSRWIRAKGAVRGNTGGAEVGDADGGLVVGAALFVVEEVQVEIHLARELRLEGADLEIEGDKDLEEAVIEEEIDEILFFAKGDAVLAPDEAKAVAEFEQEALQTGDEPVFEFAFFHRLAEAEEIEAVGVLEHLIRLLGEVFRQGEVEVVCLFVGDGAFVGPGFDLVEQDVARPAEAGGGAEIPEVFGRGFR